MALISLQEINLGFGGPLILEDVNLQIEAGERVGLIGRNGVGKSSLLKLIAEDITPNSGVIARSQNMRTAYMAQEVLQNLHGKVSEIVRTGLIIKPTEDHDAWKQQMAVEQVINRMELNGDAIFESLSAGMKRRVLLAQGLVSEPDLLLMDEPTNHLDIQSITWLEEFLAHWNGTLLFVTHDRMFLQRTAKRIVELDRGRLFDWKCDYSTFIHRKEEMLAAESDHNEQFDKKLAQEEAWIRRGIEARRTRNEGRVRALKRLRSLRQERRDQPLNVKMELQEAKRSGRLVIRVEDISFAYAGHNIINNFSSTIQRGDKVGIIGPNGSGKTTLLRLLLGELTPTSGNVELGSNLQIVYYDQLRSQLDESKSILDNVGEGRDTVTINGRSHNLVGYLEDFLFTRERLNAPISALSGGERNRLLLARLFTKPANLLVMDEPTNDLDIETLDLLEDLLLEYSGTLLLVSHDREFLNNLVTSTIVLDGTGGVSEYVGGYDDWMQQSNKRESTKMKANKEPLPTQPASTAKRLSYKEQKALEAARQELAALPGKIEKLEEEQLRLSAEMADPKFYQGDAGTIAERTRRVKEVEQELALAYQRWEELEKILGE